MAIPIITGELKVYRNRSGVWTQVYPETNDPALTVNADCQGLGPDETVQVMASDATQLPANTGTDEPKSLPLYQIFADWLNPDDYDQEHFDLVVFRDTTGDAKKKTAVYQQVSIEPEHTGTAISHLRLICIKTKQAFPTADFTTALELSND